MIRSLRTGVTGLRGNQLRLDVIGNNIAGVNTAGFKRSRVLFQDALSQRLGTGGHVGGDSSRNPSHIGHGVAVGAVDTIWSQGTLEYTDVPTDLAIGGNGFFVARSSQGNVLTRGGAFEFDANGFLVSPGGLRVQGWMAGANGQIATGALQDIRLDPTQTAPPVRTTTMALTGNLSALREVGSSEPLTMSSVIYDGAGRAHTTVLTVEKTADNEWTLVSAEIAGNPDATPPVPATPLTIANGVLTFDAEGRLTSGGNVTLGGAFPDGSGLNIALDMSKLTQFGGSTTTSVARQNGTPAGELVDFGFDQEGRLMLAFSNGVRRPAAQLALGTVTNPDGLSSSGDGFYSATAASGGIRLGRAGHEIGATLIAGAVESSNVDLAQEFTDMIVAQRGYQASARVVTTSDELLQETVMLKR